MQNAANYDHLLKVVLVGESGVGKSSIVVRYADNEFDEEQGVTIGVDFKSKQTNVDGKVVALNIWDTAGQEKFRSLTTTYYRGSQGIVLVYDITKMESFENIGNWLKEAELYSTSGDVVKALVGNKIDKESERKVSTDEAETFAREHGMLFIECSAKTSKGVQEVFEELIRKVLERPDLLQGTAGTRSTSVKVGKGKSGSGGGCAC